MAEITLPRNTSWQRRDQTALLSRRLTTIAVIAGLVLASVIVLLPLVWMFSTSLRLARESYTLPPQWLPTDWQWQNYADVFNTVPYAQYILNSLKITLAIVAGQVVTASMAAYGFARLRFPGRNFLFIMLISALMIPQFVTIIPTFILVRNLGLADTHASLILPSLVTPFGIFLMRQFFLTIPTELEDAAKMDGAGIGGIFRHIFVPLGAPGIAVMAVFAFNGYWNEYFRPLIFLSSFDKFTLPLGIVALRGPMNTGNIAVVLAGVTMSLIPMIILVIFAQRYLAQGIVMTGLKG
ncbi:MAG: carbohydrate ABC transporter permease [Anaerolineae bacterium]|nr:carbohydrate ABC transporter permease [Anaerolineae bacterium]